MLTTPGEILRNWAYRGEFTRGVAAFLALGKKVIGQAKQGKFPTEPRLIFNSAVDHTASNRVTSGLVDLSQGEGVDEQLEVERPEEDVLTFGSAEEGIMEIKADCNTATGA